MADQGTLRGVDSRQQPLPVAAPPRLPRRDRIAVLVGLCGVSALAWLDRVRMALCMGAGGAMGGMEAGALAAMTRIQHWSAADFVFRFAMSAIRRVGMRMPSATPRAVASPAPR